MKTAAVQSSHRLWTAFAFNLGRTRMCRFAAALSWWAILTASALAGDSWPQFHGPNATGLASDEHKLPADIGPDKNLIWKTALPPGHSSPVIHGDHIYLTGARGQSLLTIAIDRKTGRVLWEVEAAHKQLETVHKSAGSLAQSTPATDGERVVSFFGSCGLFCYDTMGKQLWHMPLGPFNNDFGAGSSPIIVGDRVILNQDHDTDSFLAAIDKQTGKTIWKTDRSEFPRNYSTPIIWEVGGKKQIVVVATLRAVGYDFDTGKEIWTVRGLARIINMTPLVGGDGILYIAAWSPGAEVSDRITVPPFDEILAKNDNNKNKMLEEDEVPAGPLKERFPQIDRNKDGHIDREEYETMRQIFAAANNVVLAVKPGGKGDITQTHVLWKQTRSIPYVPSPVYYKGHLFMVKNGGMVSCLDAKTGQPAKQDRVPGSANYYSSPVAGDGKIYLVSQRGELSVISAEPQWKVLSRARFDEDVFATPAIAGGRIYLRTNEYLYCFGTANTN
jgi:outer membrane protein assembly factor BamB